MTTFPMPPHHADHVLVASPSSLVRRRVLESLLPRTRYVEQATGGAEALSHLENGLWEVLFLDRRLPDLDAEELSQTVRQRYPLVKIVLLGDENRTAAEPSESVMELPPATEVAEGSDENHKRDGHPATDGSPALLASAEQCRTTGDYVEALPGMIGFSPAMQPVYRLAHLVAPRDTTVLITGPTGSGKELVARALHQLSPRADRTFAVVNCAAIPETLLEAELFGYSRGAFTGAMQSYAGRIQAAHLGTLFLDEIGDMPLSLQPKLLRFLEQKELQRLGSSQVVRVNARVISATNVDLLGLVGEGKFRKDLYYRLSAFPLAIPPLSERADDIVQLAVYFLNKFSGSRAAPVLSKEALALLLAQNWPGNVRELQNVMERALILADEQGVIGPAHLMLADRNDRSHASER